MAGASPDTIRPRRQPILPGWVRRLPAYILIWAWTAFTLAAILYIVLSALKSKREVLRTGWRLPEELVWGNFATAWNVGRLGEYLINSVLVVGVSVFAILLVSTPAAYILARARFMGREALTNLFVIGMGIPIPMLFIPIFGVLSILRLSDSLTGLSLVFVAISIPVTIYLLTGFFASLPSELEAAAVLEGCSDFQVFRYIMLPLAMPGVLTALVLNLIWLWNEYQISLVILNSPSNRTLPLGLYSLQNAMQYTGDWPGMFAGVTIVIIPTIIAYALLSEKMIAGMTMGAVK